MVCPSKTLAAKILVMILKCYVTKITKFICQLYYNKLSADLYPLLFLSLVFYRQYYCFTLNLCFIFKEIHGKDSDKDSRI